MNYDKNAAEQQDIKLTEARLRAMHEKFVRMTTEQQIFMNGVAYGLMATTPEQKSA